MNLFILQIRPDIMSKLIDEEVYKAVHVVDYQAVCFRERKTTNFASVLTTVRFLLYFIRFFVLTTLKAVYLFICRYLFLIHS